jgi:hypothetical protein
VVVVVVVMRMRMRIMVRMGMIIRCEGSVLNLPRQRLYMPHAYHYGG